MATGGNGSSNGSVGAVEKTPLQSKKFIAFLVAEVTWKVVLGIMLWKLGDGLLLTLGMAVVIVAGFIEAVYVGGQAAIDAYIRVAAIVKGTSGGGDATGGDAPGGDAAGTGDPA